ncbi:hypothetical protein [Vibrio sp. SCSIO 43136]|uniref:hypothetical protein n=1 Tax=Vibrio sp. SCSIO 43136 TaxID=2819101 RepID=UPI002075C74D|nr:hypothetical protein [Vibrio sp. SCSIO 43136]USD64229.1 hypothetical protein J4N39_08910 [Vibrio sp. SCSIO 43136]
MSQVQWYSNSICMAVRKPLPLEPEKNFYRAVAQCVEFAGNEPSFMGIKLAIIAVDSEKRLVVSA